MDVKPEDPLLSAVTPSYLQQLLVGKCQDALEDDHVGAIHCFLQAQTEGFLPVNQNKPSS